MGCPMKHTVPANRRITEAGATLTRNEALRLAQALIAAVKDGADYCQITATATNVRHPALRLNVGVNGTQIFSTAFEAFSSVTHDWTVGAGVPVDYTPGPASAPVGGTRLCWCGAYAFVENYETDGSDAHYACLTHAKETGYRELPGYAAAVAGLDDLEAFGGPRLAANSPVRGQA
jgi:hypothetical protein